MEDKRRKHGKLIVLTAVLTFAALTAAVFLFITYILNF